MPVRRVRQPVGATMMAMREVQIAKLHPRRLDDESNPLPSSTALIDRPGRTE